jgi:hypothetical protein
MKDTIRRAAVIVMLLIAFAVIAAPVAAATLYQGDLVLSLTGPLPR